MVAQEGDQAAAAAQVDEPVEDAPAVRPPVDVIAQGDDGVLGAGPDGVEQGVQGRRAAVDVADGDGARGHHGRSRADDGPRPGDQGFSRQMAKFRRGGECHPGQVGGEESGRPPD